MLKKDYFYNLVRSVLSSESSEDDVLSLMIVLHTYRFHVPESAQLDDAGNTTVLYPLTRSHSAEIIASAFPATDQQRHDCEHWNRRYNDRTPFEVASRVEGDWRLKTDRMLSLLKSTGLVARLSEDD